MRALDDSWCPAADRDNTCIYNCSYVAVDHPRAFDEAMFILLCGTGVGFSVERQAISQLPEIPSVTGTTVIHLIVPSKTAKEGWAKSLRSADLPRYTAGRHTLSGTLTQGSTCWFEPPEDIWWQSQWSRAAKRICLSLLWLSLKVLSGRRAQQHRVPRHHV